MPKIQLRAKIESGVPKWQNPALKAKAMDSFEGKEVVISIERLVRVRSNPQNAYYRGVCVPAIYEAILELGNEEYTEEDVHELLKLKFLGEVEVKFNNEVIGKKPRSTMTLSTVEFNQFTEQIQRWGAEFFNIVIPDPDPFYKTNAK